jgi:hypothetical protein
MRDVRREDDPDGPVGLQVDVGMVVRRGGRLRDAIDESHGALETLERVGLREGVALLCPATPGGE